MEATGPSVTLIPICQTTLCHIPQDFKRADLDIYRSDNFIPHNSQRD
jgi:hypothetical protein